MDPIAFAMRSGPMHTVTVAREASQSDFSGSGERNMNETPWELLLESAKAACARAYSPYSRFPVGAAVLTGEGTVSAGCNVENASFGLTLCAERNAIFRAVTEGATSIVALLLYTPTSSPVTPCGACRQVLAEFGRDARVRAVCAGPDSVEYAMAELLPDAFTLTEK
jgi:cytidine deaminase